MIAPELAQQLELLLGFNTFRDGDQVECGGKPDDARDQRPTRRIPRQAADKSPVDLQQIDRKFGQEAKRRVSSSEIVDGHPHTRASQLAQLAARSLNIMQQSRLGNL